MERIYTYHISEETKGRTVLDYLLARRYSRRLLTQLKRTDRGLLVDGAPVFTNHRLADGETLTVHIVEDAPSPHILPVPLPLHIVYEDEDILILNKAAGMPVHPSQGNHQNTLANALAFYFAEKGQSFVCRAVNRLDKDTTGLLVVAKHMLSAGILSEMVRRRAITREYLALASGLVPEEGTIDAPIARVGGSTIQRCVDFSGGERAVTHYSRILYQEEAGCSLVRLKLETGRTHQIRVHMRHIGHPLLGDFLYNPDYRLVKRQALHSCRLSFEHPVTDEQMTFCAPMPDDWQGLFHQQFPTNTWRRDWPAISAKR